MNSISDFEDMLALLERHEAEYLIVGSLAFIYHAKPRYTKDMDIWIRPSSENVSRTNQALAEFGSPTFINPGDTEQILQIGVAPNRIDLLLSIPNVRFETAWKNRIRDRYGRVTTNWIDINSLIRSKRSLDNPRHQEDVRVLLQVKKLQKRKKS